MGLFSWIAGISGRHCSYCKRGIDYKCEICGVPLCRNHARPISMERKSWFGLKSETESFIACPECYPKTVS